MTFGCEKHLGCAFGFGSTTVGLNLGSLVNPDRTHSYHGSIVCRHCPKSIECVLMFPLTQSFEDILNDFRLPPRAEDELQELVYQVPPGKIGNTAERDGDHQCHLIHKPGVER